MASRLHLGLACAALFAIAGCASINKITADPAQEMVVTANPLATAAGARMLAEGGTAVDAMVAVQTVLGLVEPQSSGLGGGAFVVYYDAQTGTTTTIDAREKAPAAVTGELFLDENGDSIGFPNAWQSGLSAGVPGVPRMLQYMHDKYGKLTWAELFQPAIAHAEEGFALTRRTSHQINGLLGRNANCLDRLFLRDPTAFAYFAEFPGEGDVACAAKPAGTVVTNQDYADTLALLASEGASAFYNGAISQDIVDAVQNDLNIGGAMRLEDLQSYQVVERPPVCIDYRGNSVCGMGPPSSGGLAVGQILGVLENFEFAGKDPLDVEVVHLFTQASRIAFADRNKYVADSDFVRVPVAGMLDKTYLAERAALIGYNDLGAVAPGTPPGIVQANAADPKEKTSGTSHVSIIDRFGNALSMTTTIESSFGNGVMVAGRGFLLNNELTDFSFKPADADGVPIANRVQPGKRPRSSMAPTIVFDADGKVSLVTGSPGGSFIIAYTAQSIMNILDLGLTPQQAAMVPHIQNTNGSTFLEEPVANVTLDYDAAALSALLTERLHTVTVRAQESGLSIIQVTEDGLVGGADLRRDGTVGGNF